MNHKFLILSILLLFYTTSCDDSRHIRHYHLKKNKTENLNQVNLSPSSNIKWEVPPNWIISKGSSMRIGSFEIPYPDGIGDLSVIKLPGTAGGLTDNVNRWRKQLNLNPHSEKEIKKDLQINNSSLGEFQWLNIINPDNFESAFIVAIFNTETHTIFVKLKASKAGISMLQSEFIKFCKSFSINNSK